MGFRKEPTVEGATEQSQLPIVKIGNELYVAEERNPAFEFVRRNGRKLGLLACGIAIMQFTYDIGNGDQPTRFFDPTNPNPVEEFIGDIQYIKEAPGKIGQILNPF